MAAAKQGHRDVCELLLRKGADPQAVDIQGEAREGEGVENQRKESRRVGLILNCSINDIIGNWEWGMLFR